MWQKKQNPKPKKNPKSILPNEYYQQAHKSNTAGNCRFLFFYLIPTWTAIYTTCFPCLVSNPLKNLQSSYYLHSVDEKTEIQRQIMWLAQGHRILESSSVSM